MMSPEMAIINALDRPRISPYEVKSFKLSSNRTSSMAKPAYSVGELNLEWGLGQPQKRLMHEVAIKTLYNIMLWRIIRDSWMVPAIGRRCLSALTLVDSCPIMHPSIPELSTPLGGIYGRLEQPWRAGVQKSA